MFSSLVTKRINNRHNSVHVTGLRDVTATVGETPLCRISGLPLHRSSADICPGPIQANPNITLTHNMGVGHTSAMAVFTGAGAGGQMSGHVLRTCTPPPKYRISSDSAQKHRIRRRDLRQSCFFLRPQPTAASVRQSVRRSVFSICYRGQ